MDRELNPQLFGPAEASRSLVPRPEATPEISSADRQFLSIQLENLRKKVKELEARLESSEGRLEAFGKAAKLKLDQAGTRLERVETYVKSTLQDAAAKMANLAGRLTNSKLAEDKIEAMLNRHNQVVQNFESKLGQMQKVINEQELKLLGYKAALEEAQRKASRP